MRCEEARRLMPMYLYGELAPAEEERLEAHVHDCRLCREESEKQQRLNQLLAGMSAELPEGLLTTARQELRLRLADESRPQGWRTWVRDFFPFRVTAAPLWMQAAAAVLLIAGGFVSGRVAPGFSQAGLAGTPVGSAVRYVEPAKSGRVQLVVDETRERVVTGTLEDESIRRLLETAMRETENAAVRAQSVEVLKNDSGSSEIRGVLLNALRHDPDPRVRLAALDGLKPFASEPQMRDVFSHVLLEDQNPGVRTQVISVLVQQPQDEMVGVFQELMRREDDAYVRQQCRRALHAMNASAEEY